MIIKTCVLTYLNLFLTHIILNTTGMAHIKTSMNSASSAVLSVAAAVKKSRGFIA